MKSFALSCVFSVSGFAAPAGFTVHTWAEPFDIEYPAAISAAADGTVYVSCDRNGSLGKEKSYGKVIACRDTDGDHKADTFVDFIPDVDSPRGGHFVRDTLYLVHPPFVSAFRDTNGDGVADEHKVLLENLGFGLRSPRGSDHTTNGLRIGIDGWLYIAVGDFGMEGTVGTDGRTITYQGGCIARVRPDGTELEVYSHHIRNSCDVAISPTLEMFTRDNTNDGKGWDIRLHHFTHGSDHGYPRLYKNFADECVTPMLSLGGGSGTGALYLSEPGLPEMLLTCDWTTGQIYHDALTKNGASYRAAESIWMPLNRAVDIDVDGMSNLYTCDWRGGKFVYAGEGVKVGLVQKLVKEDLKVEKFPDLKALSDPDIVEQLLHDSSVRRLEAQHEILARGEKMASHLTKLDLSTQTPAKATAVLFTLKQLLGKKSHPEIRKLLPLPKLNAYALRALADRLSEVEQADEAHFKANLSHPSSISQLQALIALTRLPEQKPEASKAILALAAHSKDERIRHTCTQSLTKLGHHEVLFQHFSQPVAQTALKRLHRKEVIEELLQRLDQSADSWQAIDILARLYYQEGPWNRKYWWGTRPDDRGPYFNLATWSETSRIQKVLEDFYKKLPASQRGRALEIFSRNRIEISKLDLGERDPLALALNTAHPDKAQITILKSSALDETRPWEIRLKAFRALGRVPDGKANKPQIEVLANWLEHEKERSEVARELSEFVNQPTHVIYRKDFRRHAKKGSVQASRVAWQVLLTMARSPLAKKNFKQYALNQARNNPREEGFFLALADLKVTGFESQIENAIESDNDTLIAAAKAAKKIIAAAKAEGGKKVAELPAAEVTRIAMTETGDAVKGEALYVSQGCIACHAVDQAAVQKGPYLGTAGGKFTRDYLIESILAPNAVVAQGFQTELVTMKDGAVHMGFVTREQDGQIDLRNIVGIVTQLKTEDIKSRQHQSNSMMPAGLGDSLTTQEFTDLIEYLSSLGSK